MSLPHSLKGLLLALALTPIVEACSKPQTENSSIKIVDDSLVDLDVLSNGSHEVATYDYDSGAIFDPDIPLEAAVFEEDEETEENESESQREPVRVPTDIRGRLYLPSGSGPFPVITFLHGNHATCGELTGEGNPRLDHSSEFTEEGTCPEGSIEAPSYLGYEKSARQLASWGYAVISINANRGITGSDARPDDDPSLIYARGILVLRHLEEFYTWSKSGKNLFLKLPQLDLSAKLDFSRVGMMGHSRGGEGVRYAYNIYTDSLNSKWRERIPGLRIKGIFEIAPTDAGSRGKAAVTPSKDKDVFTHADAKGTAWTVLIPGCDRDISNFDGVNPYARMLADQADGLPKAVFTLWGANHNFFNSEWQVSDAPHTCIGSQKPLWNTDTPALESFDPLARVGVTGSEAQIDTARALMYAFFSTHLSGSENKKLGHVFDPQYRLPKQLSSLGASSREYLDGNASKLILDTATSTGRGNEQLSVKSLKDYIVAQIETLAKSACAGQDKCRAAFFKATLDRSALVIEGKADDQSKAITLPFQAVQKTDAYWTIDLALAVRKECYALDQNAQATCPKYTLPEDVEIALILADGTETKSVRISAYAQLQNWYEGMLQQGISQRTANGFEEATYTYIPILFQTVRFELSDFEAEKSEIAAMTFKFPAGTDVSLFLESVRLSKRP